MTIIDSILNYRIVPVIVLNDVDNALPLADALIEGGLPVAEVTFRTEAAEESIRAMATRDEMIVGAGTVVNVGQAERAINAGAKFIVSPGLSESVVRFCQSRKVPVFPGATSATEIMVAMELGLDTVKFFPAETNGGAMAIKALAGPFGSMNFIPTGGISGSNLREYLDIPSVVAVGGSWMVPPKLIEERQFDEVSRLVSECMKLVEKGLKR